MQYKITRNLEHSGIKGQRWGVRRFQNEDGTLTEEGKKRYGIGRFQDEDGNLTEEGKKKYGTQIRKDKDGKKYAVKIKNVNDFTKDELSYYNKDIEELNKNRKMIEEYNKQSYKDMIDASNTRIENAKLTKDAADILDATAKALPTGNGKTIRQDYSYLSDEELRKRISRLQLEESYGKLTGETKYIKSGSERTREILQTTGAVVGIAGSAYVLGEKIFQAAQKK